MSTRDVEPLSKALQLNFTESEYTAIKSVAEQYHLKVPEYILSIINGRDGIKLRKRHHLRMKKIRLYVPPLSDTEAWSDQGAVCAFQTPAHKCINPLTRNDDCIIMNGKCKVCPGYVRSRA